VKMGKPLAQFFTQKWQLKVCLHETALIWLRRMARQTEFCKIPQWLKFGGKELLTQW
jgi:hypothetical protein